MKGEIIQDSFSPDTQSQDNCPPNKARHPATEISLETLEILLTSAPEEEISLADSLAEQLTHTSTSESSSTHNSIQNILKHKSHYLKRLQHLKTKKRGAEWLYRNLNYFQTQFPWELISLVENMAHTHSTEIHCQTLKPVNELGQNYLNQNYYRNRIVGQLQGLEIFTTNIRRLCYNSLEEPLNKLSEALIENADQQELQIWNDWCQNIENHFRRAEELLLSGQAFFSIRNFKLMELLPISQRSLLALRRVTDKTV